MGGADGRPVDQKYPSSHFGHGVVAASLKCRQCGYELRGLRAGGLCPECGLSIWASVLHAGDPEGAKMPRLTNPRAVGSAMLWLVLAWALASLLWVADTAVQWLDRVDPLRNIFGRWIPPKPKLIAALLVISTLWSVWKLTRPSTAHESGVVRRDFRLLLIGIVFGGLAMLELTFAAQLQARLTSPWDDIYQLAIELALVAFVLVGMAGLQGILRVIGQRSRQYRTAREGRQNVHAMMTVVAFIGVGRGLEQLSTHTWPGEGFWPNLGSVILAISYLMFVIGMAYLLVNAWWIRRTLRNLPTTLDELLVPSLPDDTQFGKTPEMGGSADPSEQ